MKERWKEGSDEERRKKGGKDEGKRRVLYFPDYKWLWRISHTGQKKRIMKKKTKKKTTHI